MNFEKDRFYEIASLFCIVVMLLFSVNTVLAGGGPLNVLVVVNDSSVASQELGQYYQDTRGLNSRNICHVSCTTANQIGLSDFTNQILNPVKNYIATMGLSNQIDYVVFSMDIPYRVVNTSGRANSLTAAMFYGFKDYPASPVCTLATGSTNDYYEVENFFAHSGDPSNERYYLSSMLTSRSLDKGKKVVDRAFLADNSNPVSTSYLLHSTDKWRAVRWRNFEDAAFSTRLLNGSRETDIIEGNAISGKHDIMGYLIGIASPFSLSPNTFLPGAIADHLTSFGGLLLDTSSQMSCLDWLEVGCAGSYGTVIEPCNYTSKFPDVRVHFWYARGFSLGESYWMSLKTPYQGVVVGDPLAAPFAKQDNVSIAGIQANDVVSGQVGLTLSASASDSKRKISQLDIFIDGLFVETITNVVPVSANNVSATIDGSTRTYSVAAGDALGDVASGLANRINSFPPLGVRATAYNDRIEIVQEFNGFSGSDITYSVDSGGGATNIHAWTPATSLLDTEYAARQLVNLSGTVDAGDTVKSIITRLDGIMVTNMVTATAGDSLLDLMTALSADINADAQLQVSSGCRMAFVNQFTQGNGQPIIQAYLISRTNTFDGFNLFVDFSVSGLDNTGYFGNFASNKDDTTARGAIFLTAGYSVLSNSYNLDTTVIPDGPHVLTLVAYEGSAVKTQTRTALPFVVSNNTASCNISTPANAQNFSRGQIITVSVDAATSSGNITSIEIYVEGKLYGTTNILPATFNWPSVESGAGSVELQAKAFSDAGFSVLSEIITVTIYNDIDGDGLPDWWEYANFGGATNAIPTEDPDGDTASNLEEFLADTNPQNSNSLLRVEISKESNSLPATLTFETSANRNYDVMMNDVDLINSGAWFVGTSNTFRGVGGVTNWLDDGTQAPLPTNEFRFYRIRAKLP